MTLLAMFGADFAKFSADMPQLAAKIERAIKERS